MKYLKYGLSCLIINNVLFSAEKDYLANAYPSLTELRFVYQKSSLERFFPWDSEKCRFGESLEGKEFKQKLLILNNLCPIAQQDNYLYPTSSIAISFFCKTFYHEDFQSILARDYLLNYVVRNNIQRNQALPEYFIPVDKEILNDLKNKSYPEIFSEKVASLYSTPLECSKEDTCSISEKDLLALKRVYNDESEDKAILFVGFSQSIPTEGSEITFDTPGYRKSLFWSKYEDQPDENHNSIKFCFCQAENFLSQYPEFEEFFDYIIIGGQTIQYIPKETWIQLGKMLKKNGRMVYPHSDYFCWGPFINKLLISTLTQDFNLYMCDNPEEFIFKEILNFASFNNVGSYGEFCYAKAQKLYWHKNVTSTLNCNTRDKRLEKDLEKFKR